MFFDRKSLVNKKTEYNFSADAIIASSSKLFRVVYFSK